MRTILAEEITKTVKELSIKANRILPEDLKYNITCAQQKEKSEIGKKIISDMIENYQQAEKLSIPVCQDTGLAVVFVEIGQEVYVKGALLEDAIQQGVREGYLDGRLRCSVVKDPLFKRVNTNDNTPAMIHTNIVKGDKIKITVAPKGAGSENMSALKMFTPSANYEDVVNFVVECVKKAGSNPCPPIVVGVGIGGNFEYVTYLSKKALCRPVSQRNPITEYQQMEEDILQRINKTGIGPQGFGGKITALAVNIETYPTHIASLPVAVNIGCHVTRHATKIL